MVYEAFLWWSLCQIRINQSNPIGRSSFGFNSVFHESCVLWFALDHARSEFLTFLLQCTEFLLTPIHTALVFRYSFSNQSIFLSCSVFGWKFIQKICATKLQLYHQHIRVLWFCHYRFFLPSVCSFVLRDIANISIALKIK